MAKKVIMVSCPEDSDFDERVRRESRRTGKSVSFIIREAFDHYTRDTGALDDYIEQDHQDIMKISRSDQDSVVESLLKQVSPDRALEISTFLSSLGYKMRSAAMDRMPPAELLYGGADPRSRRPGVL